MKKKMKSRNIIIKATVNIFIPITLVYGAYSIIYGPLGAGGAIQGGILLSAAILLIYLGYGSEKATSVFKKSFLLKNTIILGVIYILLGVTGLLFFTNFGKNIFLRSGKVGSLLSTGNLMFYNVLTGLLIFTSIGFIIVCLIKCFDTNDVNRE